MQDRLDFGGFIVKNVFIVDLMIKC